VSNKVNSNFGISLMALIAVVVLVLVVNGLAGMMHKPAAPDMSADAVAERIGPVARLNTGEPIAAAAPVAAAPSAARAGKDIYATTCFACHDTGAAGAPKKGDAAAWGKYTAKGIDDMLKNAISGVGAMPPRGTCGNCSDAELRDTIQYIIDSL